MRGPATEKTKRGNTSRRPYCNRWVVAIHPADGASVYRALFNELYNLLLLSILLALILEARDPFD